MSEPPLTGLREPETGEQPAPRRRRRLSRRGLAVLSVGLVAVISATVAVVLSHSGSPSVRAVPKPRGSTPVGSPGSPVGTVPVPAGFPSAATTGVPAGTSLTAYTGPMTISKAGTVISGVLITGCPRIVAADVVLEDSKIVCDGKVAVLSITGPATGVTVSDVELDGEGVAVVGIDEKDAVVEGVNIYDTGDGVHLGAHAVLRDSYIHDLANQPQLHHDCLQTLHGSSATDIQVTHNTLEAYSPHRNDNTVYHMGSGAISNIVVSDNYMDGGHYSIEIADDTTQHGIVFRDNRFGRHYHFDIIRLGADGAGVQFVGNVWADDGKPATEADSKNSGQGS